MIRRNAAVITEAEAMIMARELESLTPKIY